MAINADPGTTFYDAEHIVFLMQENRSFDHMFGSLKGVRGFNDPRAVKLPDENKVWLQKDDKGNTYAPFHIDINKTKITWQGGLAHSWPD
ncbi:alkaline phosphatase family protein, partial [Salmonella enterica]|uniref:alkaline phosphatase family protein n=1 Tax=Salmonella enterica TaxID=28901 RepID=UPI002666D8BA